MRIETKVYFPNEDLSFDVDNLDDAVCLVMGFGGEKATETPAFITSTPLTIPPDNVDENPMEDVPLQQLLLTAYALGALDAAKKIREEGYNETR